jgi:hypothetical protein
MGQRFQNWRSEAGETSWLSMLVRTMEETARPGFCPRACDPSVLAALRAQLARPTSACTHGVSDFSRRN